MSNEELGAECLDELIEEIDCRYEHELVDDDLAAFQAAIIGEYLRRKEDPDSRLKLECQRLGCTAQCDVVRSRYSGYITVEGNTEDVARGNMIESLPGCLLDQ